MVERVSGKTEDASGVEVSLFDVVKRVEELEREVNRLKAMAPYRFKNVTLTKAPLRGSAELLVSLDELERGFEDAKTALLKYGS